MSDLVAQDYKSQLSMGAKVEEQGKKIQGLSELQNEFKASLDNSMRPRLKIQNRLNYSLSKHKTLGSVFSTEREGEREGGTFRVNQVCVSLGLQEVA